MKASELYRKNVKGELITINDKYLKPKDVATLCSMTRAGVYRLMNKFQFPPQHNTSPGRVAWLECDVEEWKKLGAENFFIVYGEQLKAAKAQTDKAA